MPTPPSYQTKKHFRELRIRLTSQGWEFFRNEHINWEYMMSETPYANFEYTPIPIATKPKSDLYIRERYLQMNCFKDVFVTDACNHLGERLRNMRAVYVKR